jgi:hypothetical protein
MSVKQVIRDFITIDERFPFLDGVTGGGTLRLIARRVEIAQNYSLTLSDQKLEIFADAIIGLAGSGIVSNGKAGFKGVDGASGLNGNGSHFDGSDGGNGTPGTDGTEGGYVRITTQAVQGLSIEAVGGIGGPGGDGGIPGNGSHREIDSRLIHEGWQLQLGNGGRGGDGGTGGLGGPGGSVTMQSVTAPILLQVNVDGGPGGSTGAGRHGGKMGTWDIKRTSRPIIERIPPEITRGDDGLDGKYTSSPVQMEGRNGHTGSLSQTDIDLNRFWQLSAASGIALDWARHRLFVGEYTFRRYLPADPSRSTCLKDALVEFTACVGLLQNESLSQNDESGHIVNRANHLRECIMNGFNVLGLPYDLDVYPNFESFMSEYTGWADLEAGFIQQGFDELRQAEMQDGFSALMKFKVGEALLRQVAAESEHTTLEKEKTYQEEDVKELDKRLADVQGRIEKEEHSMRKSTMSLDGSFGSLWDIALAIGAVVAAFPTAGASLLVLAPEVLTLTKSVYDNWEPLAKAFFSDGDGKVLNEVQDKYKNIADSQDIDNVITAGKAVISLIEAGKRLAQSKTPDKSKLVSLLQQAAELAHERLLLMRQKEIINLRINAQMSRAESEKLLVKFGNELSGTWSQAVHAGQQAGLRIIRFVQSKVDNILFHAFVAQRSIEIITLESHASRVHYDTGYIDPDLEANYREEVYKVTSQVLRAAYLESWQQILEPVAFQTAYASFFSDTPTPDILRMTIQSTEDLQTFQKTGIISLAVDIGDLPDGRTNVKTRGVYVSLVKATSTDSIISVMVTHGNRYTERLAKGERSDQFLEAKSWNVFAHKTEIDESDSDLKANQAYLPFWRRGSCGRWELRISASEESREPGHIPSFENLQKIQLWIVYDYFR